MTYANNYNPYFQQYPNHYASALQQIYNPQTQPQQIMPQPQVQQPVQPQPAIVQSQTNMSTKMNFVSNKEEATASPVDLINGTPSYFFNKEKNEFYFKQFDVPTGKGVFKTYKEVKAEEEEKKPEIPVINYDEQFKNINNDLKHFAEGIDSIHRILAKMQSKEDVEDDIIKSKKRG